MFKNFNHISDLPAILPVFPLRGALLLPSTQIPLHIFEPRYLEMVEHVLRTHRLIALVQPDPNESAGGDRQGLARIGCLGQLTSWQVTGERSCDIGLAGMIRFELEEEVHIDTSFRQIQVNYEAFAEDLHGQDQSGGIDRKKFVEKLQYLPGSKAWNLTGKRLRRYLTRHLLMRQQPLDLSSQRNNRLYSKQDRCKKERIS